MEVELLNSDCTDLTQLSAQWDEKVRHLPTKGNESSSPPAKKLALVRRADKFLFSFSLVPHRPSQCDNRHLRYAETDLLLELYLSPGSLKFFRHFSPR